MANGTQNLITRPPVVVVMGHVDHGKTTLLDYIRRTAVAAGEAGGITQHIGAYEIEHNEKKITFLDTPGHEAFSKMRSRGANAADVAILVVAADESVKPQTKEALSHIRDAKTSFLVAVTKIDKPGANPDKVKQDLAQEGVLVEGWGGKIPAALVSAKTGEGVNELLDLILLVAELEELKANPQNPAKGVVIESHLDPRRGPTATLLILDGTLRKGDPLSASSLPGKVKILENFLGKPVDSLSVSSPAVVLGWEGLPSVGDAFRVGEAPKETEEKRKPQIAEGAKKEGVAFFNLILKADVTGSLEALEESVKKLAGEIGVELKILFAEVGDITESDVRLADTAGATILGFRVEPNREAEHVLRTVQPKILQGEVIYELLDAIKKEFEGWLSARMREKISGRLEVLAIFSAPGGKSTGARQVVGGKVLEGKFVKGARISIVRKGAKVAEGRIVNLQVDRQDVAEVVEGQECGILCEAPLSVVKGDILEVAG